MKLSGTLVAALAAIAVFAALGAGAAMIISARPWEQVIASDRHLYIAMLAFVGIAVAAAGTALSAIVYSRIRAPKHP